MFSQITSPSIYIYIFIDQEMYIETNKNLDILMKTNNSKHS